MQVKDINLNQMINDHAVKNYNSLIVAKSYVGSSCTCEPLSFLRFLSEADIPKLLCDCALVYRN